MVKICNLCRMAHAIGVSCEEAKRNSEKFARDVEHHRRHCDGCPDPYEHVRNLRRVDHLERRPKRKQIENRRIYQDRLMLPC